MEVQLGLFFAVLWQRCRTASWTTSSSSFTSAACTHRLCDTHVRFTCVLQSLYEPLCPCVFGFPAAGHLLFADGCRSVQEKRNCQRIAQVNESSMIWFGGVLWCRPDSLRDRGHIASTRTVSDAAVLRPNSCIRCEGWNPAEAL